MCVGLSVKSSTFQRLVESSPRWASHSQIHGQKCRSQQSGTPHTANLTVILTLTLPTGAVFRNSVSCALVAVLWPYSLAVPMPEQALAWTRVCVCVCVWLLQITSHDLLLLSDFVLTRLRVTTSNRYDLMIPLRLRVQVADYVDQFVVQAQAYANVTNGDNVMFLMGSDFHYENAAEWFVNLGSLMAAGGSDGVCERESACMCACVCLRRRVRGAWRLESLTDRGT